MIYAFLYRFTIIILFGTSYFLSTWSLNVQISSTMAKPSEMTITPSRFELILCITLSTASFHIFRAKLACFNPEINISLTNHSIPFRLWDSKIIILFGCIQHLFGKFILVFHPFILNFSDVFLFILSLILCVLYILKQRHLLWYNILAHFKFLICIRCLPLWG